MRETPPGAEISLYLHIPFCRRLCWFCACRTQGTKTDAPLAPYVASVLAEAKRVRASFPDHITVRRMHLGGGTPTLPPASVMESLLGGLDRIFGLNALQEFSVEIDPVECDRERLGVLRDYGMTRASLGVQDFEPRVQAAIGREQSPEITQQVVGMLRELGIEAINFDLLYGLPFQNMSTLERTLDTVLSMNPSRLALYGYAHVPWMSKRQTVIPVEALPDPEARYGLFERARNTLLGQGYLQIGIDHFARPGDELAQAFVERRLRRSFQGYTDDRISRLVGLGSSSVSRYPQGYAQNQSSTRLYQAAVRDGGLAVSRGLALSPGDRCVAEVIEHLMCYFEVRLADLQGHGRLAHNVLSTMADKFPEAVNFRDGKLRVERWARPLVRIIAASAGATGEERQSYSAAI